MKSNGLEVYKNALSHKECQSLIYSFEHDDRKGPGVVGGPAVDTTFKASTDLSPWFQDPSYSQYNEIIQPVLDEYIDHFSEKYPILDDVSSWDLDDGYNIQKYVDGEGYFKLHCEHARIYPLRLMAWMIYLNDAECGTEFPYLNTTLKAQEGTLAIWSAGWTHAHKGVTPNKGEKYIATGWYSMLVY